MKAGEIFMRENRRCVRPGLGLAPMYYEVLWGKKVNRDVKMGMIVEWGTVE
jgi:N-acetylneuraminate synthase